MTLDEELIIARATKLLADYRLQDVEQALQVDPTRDGLTDQWIELSDMVETLGKKIDFIIAQKEAHGRAVVGHSEVS